MRWKLMFQTQKPRRLQGGANCPLDSRWGLCPRPRLYARTPALTIGVCIIKKILRIGPGLRVVGFPGHWVAVTKCDPVPCLPCTPYLFLQLWVASWRYHSSISYHRGPTFNKLSCSESHFVDKQICYTLKIVQLHKMFFFDSSVRNNQHQNVGGHTDGGWRFVRLCDKGKDVVKFTSKIAWRHLCSYTQDA